MDRKYMERAIELARKGIGRTNPNPRVGAVIVKDNRIIGEGYHEQYGGLHAERNAIASLTESAEGAEIYVTLEPCCHYGKTPPCTQAIIENKISRVIIGSRDPNPLVSGKGAEQLRQAGIEVVQDYMKEECDELNPVFFHYISTGMPYVVMKYAMTADGKIATRTGASKWITGESSRKLVQDMRNEYMGIMAGIGTVLADDPLLTVRDPDLRSPVRIICDSDLRLPENSKICETAEEYRTIVACAAGNSRKAEVLRKKGIEIVEVPDGKGRVDLEALMKYIGEQKIDSVLVEGGGGLNYSVLQAGMAQKIYMFVAPKIFGGSAVKTPVEGEGIAFPDEAVRLKTESVKQIDEDLLIEYTCLRRN